MKLMLMRHGDALQYAPTDAERPLSERGREEVVAAARRIQSEGGVACIFASPYLRARQTAQLVRESLALEEPVRGLTVTPDVTVPYAVDQLNTGLSVRKYPLLLVTHQPIISRLIHYLTDIEQPMGTAAVALLEYQLEDAALTDIQADIETHIELDRGSCELLCVL